METLDRPALRRPRVALWPLRAALAAHLLAVLAQPVLAGMFLTGDVDAIDWHATNGVALAVVALLVVAAALGHTLAGRGGWWVLVAAVLLFLADGFQIDAGFLNGKAVTVAGYPGDWCGDVPFRRESCDQEKDLATVPFAGPGTVSVDPRQPGLLHHTADTHKAQSGSPVWMLFRDGTRYLVGIHTGPGTTDAVTQRALNNRAVHLSPDVVALVRSWMPGVATV